MNLQHTALVLVEYQNDFLAEDGKLHDAIKDVLERNRVVEHTNAVIAAARRHGVMIVHAPILFSTDYREIGANPYGILKLVKDAGAFQKGTWGGELSEAVDRHEEDIVIDGKSSICGFSGTNLDYVLRSHGITTLALAGMLTNICIESTMRTAYNSGYQVYTLTDCVATIGEEQQHIAVEHNFPMFSTPLTHDAFIARLDEAAADPQAA